MKTRPKSSWELRAEQAETELLAMRVRIDRAEAELEALRNQRNLLLNAAQTVLDAAESEMWLYYKGTDESRLRSLQDAVDKVEGVNK